jgi:hypothetical protein
MHRHGDSHGNDFIVAGLWVSGEPVARLLERRTLVQDGDANVAGIRRCGLMQIRVGRRHAPMLSASWKRKLSLRSRPPELALVGLRS